MKRVLSFSGGKDSTAMYLLALGRGKDFLPVFADTGHEHQLTYDFIRELPRLTGGPKIRWVKADFTGAIARKRKFIAKNWPGDGVPEDRIARALALLHPSGIPFLDLCLLKGRFPSTMARFCSQELKHFPVYLQVIAPFLEAGHRVMSWQGVRAEESPRRAALPVREKTEEGLSTIRPILKWSWEDVFAIHRKHGIEPNPLYRLGCSRVGCMPCIHARKDEIRNIAHRFPDEIDRVSEWERLVTETCKRGLSSFFSHDKVPGDHQGRAGIPMPDIREVVEWSRTARGGKQFGFASMMEPAQCSSLYGLCE